MKDFEKYFSDIKNRDYRNILLMIWDKGKQLIPDVEENMSYGVPALKVNGKPVVVLAAHKAHMGLYPASEKVISSLKDELKDYETSKGTIKFTVDNPIPDNLLKKLIELRLKEINS